MADRDRVTTTLDSALIGRIDAIAEVRNESRSATIERILLNGIDEEENLLANLGVGIQGKIMALLLQHPKILASMSKALGDVLTDEHLAKLEEGGPDVIAAGKRYRNYKKSISAKGKSGGKK